MVLVHGDGVHGEERCGNPGQRRCEPVHVVEQVEGVRQTDEPQECDHTCQEVVRDQAGDRQPAEDHQRGRRKLRGQLRDRPE